ncbi:Increased rDNA silencing protein [Didymella heteroderae]|uniref:Increased rDNA silencing protein n=1 Tax=Didymella heteroderae TaxID=1769908 RepID=A0A9P5C6S2_9PLEO|nr:Increased rDNA silencing protein [Didymella heteroderae]
MSSSARSRSLAPQSTGVSGTQHNVRDAALIGASSAFAKPPTKPQHLTNTYTGSSNGALLAATKVSTGRPSTSGGAAPLQRDYTGGSSRSVGRPQPSPKHASSSSSLGVPDTHVDRAPSPAHTAATLAAARLSPLRPAPQARGTNMISERYANERDVLPPSGSVGSVLARLEQQRPSQPASPRQQPRRKRDSFGSQSAASAVASTGPRDKSTDDTPIPPTNSLVKIFEQNRPVTPTRPPTTPSVVVKNSPPPVKSPKPQRNFTLPPEPQNDAPLARKRTNTPPPKPKSKPSIDMPPQQTFDGTKETSRSFPSQTQTAPLKSPPIKQKPIQLAALNTKAITGPQGRPKSQDSKRSATFNRRLSTSIESNAPSSPASFKSAREEQEEDEKIKLAIPPPLEEEEKAKPALPPPRRSNTRKTESAPADAKLLKPSVPPPRRQGKSSSPLSPPDRLQPRRLSPPNRPSSATGSVYHNPYQRESVKAITKHMTGESLSSAIMGAALASSRTTSPAPPFRDTIEPLFPPRTQKHHHHPFHRSPSPQKSSPPKATGKLRTTMRKDPSPPSSSDDEIDFKGKGNRIMGMKVRKHPNKHHEGTRKRWRDAITERERKRYEGVWAANKGVLLPMPVSKDKSGMVDDDDPSLDVLNLVVREIWSRSRLPEHVLEEVWALVDGREVGRLTRVEFVVGLWLVDQRLKGRKLPTRVSDSVWTSARGLGIKVKVRT